MIWPESCEPTMMVVTGLMVPVAVTVLVIAPRFTAATL